MALTPPSPLLTYRPAFPITISHHPLPPVWYTREPPLLLDVQCSIFRALVWRFSTLFLSPHHQPECTQVWNWLLSWMW